MTDENRDIGRAIGRIFEELQSLKRRNNPDTDLALAESAAEQIGVDDSTTTTTRSGTDSELTYGTSKHGFSEYE